MPVDTLHPSYTHASPDWVKMRDVMGGTRAVKGRREIYLPRLSGQEDAAYNSYLCRAQFFGATGKTAEALVGFIFRRNPEVTIPDTMADIASDLTLSGLSLYDYSRKTAEAVMAVGRSGSLVDFDELAGRPKVAHYCAEDIINWRTGYVGGKFVLSMLVLHELDNTYVETPETAALQKPDEFQHITFDQWRVFTLVPDAAGAFVKVEVWRRKPQEAGKGPGEWFLVSQQFPTRRGVGLGRIPFIFHNPSDSQPNMQRPPLLDMADVNLSHYMTSADLENGRHVCGIPTPYATGFDKSEVTGLMLGSSFAWVAENPQAKAGFVEFNGEGLGALEKAIQEKEGQMAALGAKMLEPEAKKAEAFGTVELRSSAETSALSKMAHSLSGGISDVLQWIAWWIGTAAEPEELAETAKIVLSQDFLSTRMAPDELAQMVAAWMAGAIDWETLIWNLRRGEMVDAQRTDEEIRQSIKDNPPMGNGAPFSEPDPVPPPTVLPAA